MFVSLLHLRILLILWEVIYLTLETRIYFKQLRDYFNITLLNLWHKFPLTLILNSILSSLRLFSLEATGDASLE